jgi:hypothetical protein
MNKQCFLYIALITAVLLLGLSSRAGHACIWPKHSTTTAVPKKSKTNPPLLLHQGIINF